MFRMFTTLLIGLLGIGAASFAQEPPPLTVGQAVISEINATTPVLRYRLQVNTTSAVVVQALAQSTQPTITILDGVDVVAIELNTTASSSIALTALLSPGTYTVEIGSQNGTPGSVAILVASATPVTVNDLTLGISITGQVDAANPILFFRLTALPEQTLLVINSGLPNSGVIVRLFNETTDTQSALIGPDVPGATLTIASSLATYRLEVQHSGSELVEPFSLCWTAGIGDCETLIPLVATPIPAVGNVGCTVTPTASSVNVRVSASVTAPALGALSSGQTAPVLGIAPDNSFYNINFNGTSGWVAASVVATSGDCSNVIVVVPPPFTPIPTVTPVPSATPVPTQTNTPVPTPSGPCLLTLTSPTNVYTFPNADISFLFDQVQSGQLIPTGKLEGGAWWQTNYASAWIQTSTFGVSVTVSGNCDVLPTIPLQ